MHIVGATSMASVSTGGIHADVEPVAVHEAPILFKRPQHDKTLFGDNAYAGIEYSYVNGGASAGWPIFLDLTDT
jgi:hypothetical protein